MFRKIAAVLSAAALGVGMAVLGFAAPATAHTGDLHVIYECNPETGMYDGTAYLTISQTGLDGTTYWAEGTTSFQGTPTSTSDPIALTSGPVPSSGAGQIVLGQVSSLPGDSTVAPWVYAFTTWTDNFTKGSDGRAENLAGDCKKSDEPIADATLSFTPPTCTTGGTVEPGALSHATWTSPLVIDGQNYSATATADDGYTFPDGSKTKVFEGVLPGPDTSLCPTNIECPAIVDGPTATNLDLAGWDPTFDTRSAGHWNFVPGALEVWTDDNSSQAKVSWARGADYPGYLIGQLSVNWTGTNPPPGINLFIDFDNDGVVDGTLVYEPVYDQDLWLTNGSAQWVKDNAPVVGGGNGSPWHGTVNQWLTKFPDLQVKGEAFAFGSGILGSGNLLSLVMGCAQYTFDRSAQPPSDTWKDVEKGPVDCSADNRSITFTFWRVDYSWSVEGQSWVPGDPYEYKEPVVIDRSLRPGEVEENCAIEGAPEASLTDECGPDNYKLTLSDPSGYWAWSKPVLEGDTLAIQAVPVGAWYFPEGTQTQFEFELDNSDCPIPTVQLPVTGTEVPLHMIGFAGLLLLAGAGGVLFAARRHH